MEIRLQRDALLAELALLQGIVERRTTIPILSHLLLDARDGKLSLAATDLDVSLSTWCPGDIRRDGAVAVQAKKFHEIVRSLGESGVTVLLSSHILAEVQQVCHSVSIIGNGRLIASGSVAELVGVEPQPALNKERSRGTCCHATALEVPIVSCSSAARPCRSRG